ncbi:hypothetical protein D1007_23806 [Hordeum vulgare]|nr:hypothetical protein D1007_23806 [Hordeum vulgare]
MLQRNVCLGRLSCCLFQGRSGTSGNQHVLLLPRRAREVPDMANHIGHIPVRRSALRHRLPCHRRELLCRRPYSRPLIHQLRQRPLDVVSPDLFGIQLGVQVHVHARHLDADADAGAEHVHDQRLVQELVGEVRPCQERHAVGEGLQRRVPPAVRQEAAHRRVRQDAHLRRPPADDEAAAAHALVEPGVDVAGLPVPDHPDERPVRRFQAGGELGELRRQEAGQGAEADIEHGLVRPPVEPRGEQAGVDGRAVASSGRRLGVGVQQAERSDRPHLPVERRSVSLDVRALESHARVEEEAVGGGLGEQRVTPFLVQPRKLEEPKRRRPVRDDAHRKTGHLELLEVAGDAVLHAVLGQAMLREEEERRRAVEHKPWDVKPARDVGRPRVAGVGDETVRPPWQRPEVRLQRAGEQPDGFVEEREVGQLRDHLVALAPLGQPKRRPRELELSHVDGEPLAGSVLQDGPVACGGDGRQDDGDARAAAAGDEARQVEHGDHVARRKERHQDEV